MIASIELRGGPADVGAAHGEELRDEIAATLAIYRDLLGRGDDELRPAVEPFGRSIRRFAPALAEEIAGIARGADLARWEVDLLNARSELLAGDPDGCTVAWVAEHGLLGQTWDWIDDLEPLAVVLRIRGDGPSVVTVTEPGIVGKIGANGAGVGVCLNFMSWPGPHRGVPIHALLRGAMEATSAAVARETVARAGHGRAAAITVGDRTGAGFNAEFLGPRTQLTDIGAQRYAHTNHADEAPETTAIGYADNSLARLERARTLLGEVEDLAGLWALLDDRTDPDHPICTPYRPWRTTRYGTTASVAMDLLSGALQVRLGPSPEAAVASFALG